MLPEGWTPRSIHRRMRRSPKKQIPTKAHLSHSALVRRSFTALSDRPNPLRFHRRTPPAIPAAPRSPMRVLSEGSGASVPRRAAVLRPSPRPSRRLGEGASLARPKPGAGATDRWQVVPPSSTAGWPELGVPFCATSYGRRVSVCFKCFKCFRGMLQVFHTDVAKVDRNVLYVAMFVHVCCRLLFSMFYLFFRSMLQVCLFGCCICFHTYDTSVFI
jgi:hypothetical protein